jgi:hypothetical protein
LVKSFLKQAKEGPVKVNVHGGLAMANVKASASRLVA